MILFFISLFLTALTAFFVTSVFENKEFIKCILLFFIIMFANLVGIIELLSLFSLISAPGILILNLVSSLIAGRIWYKKGCPGFQFNFKPYFKKLFFTLKSDKFLLVLGLSFLFMCGVTLFLISFMPVVNPDAEAYHVLRSVVWVCNKNLNHFPIGDVRNLPMPINSEILYSWLFVFLKKQLWLGIFPFVGFIMSLLSLYGIMNNIGLNERRKLWTLFLLSSFPSVIVQISGTETDVIIAGLVLASIYLFWNALKNPKISTLYFSALAYALAIGTKTPALMLVLPVGLWMLWMAYSYKQKDFYKPIVWFLGFGVINFVLFASYNYVLNFIDFGNILGPQSFIDTHKNLYGIKGMFAGFIKHLFLFFDFTGFKWNDTLGIHLLNLKNSVLAALGLGYIPDGLHNKSTDELNRSLLEPLMGMSILGFLVYLPCWIKSLCIPLFSRKKRDLIIASFGYILLGAIIVMSFEIVYMAYSIRFLTSFCIVAAPVLAYSYIKKANIVKFIITFFALFGLLLISTHLWARPVVKIVGYFKNGASVHDVRNIAKCSLFFKEIPKDNVILNEMCKMEDRIRHFDKRNKILYFGSNSENLLIIKLLEFEGYKIDFAQAEEMDKINLFDYNILINLDNRQVTSTFVNENRGPYYSPVDGVRCTYLGMEKEAFYPGRGKAPYHLECSMSNRFLNNYGFRLYDTLSTTLRENKSSYKLNYMFYENTHNPIIGK